ncbi:MULTISPECIES: colanic acid biosynthesis protein WcaM [Enterobacteriaceae]|uniref:colanic acid biosynthesis protein WcaM n=1 Tax=Enterobacteriaceae TaxID=543 RepID=UPI0010B65FCA|nr:MULTISPECIES: colanic acid biosynthesis protein WcaM [Enterobacteriaceae]MDP4344457.1 colanic acid biosynthesis protein WcaM [Escherichia coli]MDP4370541.1 colanic acid biosynthesis protein WcaM [Escherichia coli]VFS74402.1 colanic acid biosynthesis protein [Escherichia coli]
MSTLKPESDINPMLSRRRLLQTGAVFATVPFMQGIARAAGAGAVNVQQYHQTDWPDAFNRAFSAASVVSVPAGLVCDGFNSMVTIPAGKTLQVAGEIKGEGKGGFILQDHSQVLGQSGGHCHNLVLDVRGSDCTISGLEMTGFGPVAQIFIGPNAPAEMRNLTLDKLHIHHANYAILRQGFHNKMTGVRITNGRFTDLQGDAVEWNVAINDSDLVISDHVIDNINCTNGKINWGIGIGLAGSTYDNSYPEGQTVKRFVVANITGSNCRQLVHVENGKHFVIRNIKANNISHTFSQNAGIDNATIAIYGSDNFLITNVDMVNSAGMLIGYGVVKGNYLSIPQNFTLSDVRLDNSQGTPQARGIQISCGNATSFVSLTNLTLTQSVLELHNKPQHLFMRDIKVIRDKARGAALRMNFDLRKDVRGRFMAKDDTLISLANIHAVDEHGQPSVDIDRIDQQHINVKAVNFRLPQ